MKLLPLLCILGGAAAAPAAQAPPLHEDTSVQLTQALAEYPDAQPHAISKRGYGVQSDDLSGPCKPVTVVFARGTLELGNVGLLAGPPFFDALAGLIGRDNLAVQGVPYSANIFGYLAGGDRQGSRNFAQMADKAAAQCPDSQLVLAGYSQGAQLVHNGAAQMKRETAAHVRAVVLFGDPFEGRALPNISSDIVDTFCFATDLICKNTIIVAPSHLSYSIDAQPAAQFVAGKCSW